MTNIIARCAAKKILGARLVKEKIIKNKLKERINLQNNSKPEEFLTGKIALATEESKEQHYEVPTDFFKYVLGDNLKYSCNIFAGTSPLTSKQSLTESENDMLDVIVKRANVKDKMKILDLGCGWGSLTLHLAKNFPGSQITACSHSKTQRKFIQEQLKKNNLTNVKIVTVDVNDLELESKFDRIISIELFEHINNYDKVMGKLSNYLNKDGLLFIHHFCHKNFTYTFDPKNSWMAKHFFDSGKMLNKDYLKNIAPKSFSHQESWEVNGMHYAKTCDLWEKNLTQNYNKVFKTFKNHYGGNIQAIKWVLYWQLFFLACKELFNYNNGTEWFVVHHLFKKS